MLVRTLANQFVRDLQVSWQKTAILCALFLVGLYFWIPPLLRAVGDAASADATATAASTPSTPVPAAIPAASDQPETRTLSTWQQADEVPATDPLVRSAEVAAIQSDPFRLDESQFPPPVLFEEEPKEPRPGNPAAETNAAGPDPVLRSTIVGVSRRAAFINQKLYFEGSEVRVKGELWQLAEIHPRKVVLKKGDAAMELTIAAPSAASSAE